MSAKEEFLKIQSNEELFKRKEEFKDLDFRDEEIAKHHRKLYQNDFKKGIIVEVYKHPKD